MLRRELIPALCLLNAACSSGGAEQSTPEPAIDETGTIDATTNTDSNWVDETTISSAPEPAAPIHRYDTKEGDLYGYVGAISEEDRKRGVAVGKVLMYRYEGNEGGAYRLTSFDAMGRQTGAYECRSPCVAIKAYTWTGVERWAYNPNSVIGAAFEDAINGQLVAYRPAPVAAPQVIDSPATNATDEATTAEPTTPAEAEAGE